MTFRSASLKAAPFSGPRRKRVLQALTVAGLCIAPTYAPAFSCKIEAMCQIPVKCEKVSHTMFVDVLNEGKTVRVRFIPKDQVFVMRRIETERHLLNAASSTLDAKKGVKSLTVFRNGDFSFTHHSRTIPKSDVLESAAGARVILGHCEGERS